MPEPSLTQTSVFLLGRVRQKPADQAAWTEFARKYGRMIQNWSRRWGLDSHDAEDLSQKVLLQLSQQMTDFQYNPKGSFRAYLKTIAYRAWCDHLKRRQRERATGDEAALEMLDAAEARENCLEEIEDQSNRERLAEAMQTVQARVRPHTWQAFRLLAQEGLSGQEAAQRLNMKVGAVWVARSKVQKMIAEEIRRLKNRGAGG